MQKEIADAIWEDVKRLDEVNFQLGDVLDVKASIILVVITLLGALSTSILLLPNLSATIKLVQVIAVVGIVLAVVFSIIALWPRDFKIPPTPESWVSHINKLKEEHKDCTDAAALILQKFHEARMRVAMKRITSNKAIAEKKAKLNDLSFYATAGAILMELITLGWLVRWRL